MIKSIKLGLIAMCVLTAGTLSAQQTENRITTKGIAAQSSKGDFTPYEFSRHDIRYPHPYLFCFTNIITGLSSSSNFETISFNLPSLSWPFL